MEVYFYIFLIVCIFLDFLTFLQFNRVPGGIVLLSWRCVMVFVNTLCAPPCTATAFDCLLCVAASVSVNLGKDWERMFGKPLIMPLTTCPLQL